MCDRLGLKEIEKQFQSYKFHIPGYKNGQNYNNSAYQYYVLCNTNN